MNINETLRRLDRRFGPMRREDPQSGELEIDRRDDHEPFDPEWDELGEAGA